MRYVWIVCKCVCVWNNILCIVRALFMHKHFSSVFHHFLSHSLTLAQSLAHTHTHTYGPIGERAFSFAGNSNAREYTTRVNEFMDCVWALRIYKVQQTYHNKGAKYWSYSNNSNNNQTINIRTYSMQIIIWRKESHTLRTTLNGGVRMLQWTHYTLDESIYLRSVCLVIAIGIFRTFFGYSQNCIKFWD